ncbi:hypothetical protein BJ138DRAFT_1082817 [Hygrophoropsis aurantiaca]|uniref:Uncharacterized protein n=1 Tax=Hygrophoropsis aurantiaca TaxID=72124 RepID=A0ACB8AHP4_9AGAM|nr:hypothetical protein BJ138DRAFT_1082817 [Hygrophoropsis aurantiaca]
MSKSNSNTIELPKEYFSRDFIISAGSILFRRDPATRELQICVLYHCRHREYRLPSGRKDVGECIGAAAVRETYEETGYPCKLLPCKMETRATSPGVDQHPSVIRSVENATEPFAVTIRQQEETGLKIVWWYVTEATGDKIDGTQTESECYNSQFFEAEQAITKLAHLDDRRVAEQAWGIVKTQLGLM